MAHIRMLLIISLAVVACAEDDGTGSDTDGFSKIYSEVIEPGCSCHFSPDHPSNLDFSTEDGAYAALVGAPADGSACGGSGTRVISGDPDNSLLYIKVSQDDPGCGGRMPLGGTLSADKQELIRTWIADGAKR